MFMRTGVFSPAEQAGGMGLSVGIHMAPSPMVLLNDFRSIGLALRGLNEPMRDSVTRVMSGESGSIARTFRSQGRPPGSWPALSQATQQSRSRLGYKPTRPILRRSNKLYRAATAKARWEFRSTGNEAAAFVGSFPRTVPYAASMHFGYDAQNIPARPFMVITDEDSDRIQNHFANWAESKIRQQFRNPAAMAALKLRPARRAAQRNFLESRDSTVPRYLAP